MRRESALCLGLPDGKHDVSHFGNGTGRGVQRLSTSILAGVWTLAGRS